MGVQIVDTPQAQIAAIMERHSRIAEKHPALKCMVVDFRVDNRFYLRFGNSVLGVGTTAEGAVAAAVLTFERFGHIPWTSAELAAVLPIWVRKIAKPG